MKTSRFAIGQTYLLEGAVWLCTDVGTRTVTAIRIDQAQVVTSSGDGAPATAMAIDPRVDDGGRWLAGPPYALAEEVLDEDALPSLVPTPFWTPGRPGPRPADP